LKLQNAHLQVVNFAFVISKSLELVVFRSALYSKGNKEYAISVDASDKSEQGTKLKV